MLSINVEYFRARRGKKVGKVSGILGTNGPDPIDQLSGAYNSLVISFIVTDAIAPSVAGPFARM